MRRQCCAGFALLMRNRYAAYEDAGYRESGVTRVNVSGDSPGCASEAVCYRCWWIVGGCLIKLL